MGAVPAAALVDQQAFIFYASSMEKPGPADSGVKTLTSKAEVIPNSLIVPLKKGQKAKPGDLILSWWQSGSGMMRAIVVPGGTPEAPKVLYLDMDFKNPTGCAQRQDTLKPDSFQALSEWAPGTTVAYGAPQWKHAQVLRVEGKKVLLLGFAGHLRVADKKDCVPLPVQPPKLKVGDKLFAHTGYGTVEAGTVEKVDPAIGRIFVKFSGGARQTVAVAFGDVILKLPAK